MNLPFESSETSREKLLILLASKAYKNGSFTLSSGRHSNHYVNCKPVTLSGIGLLMLSNMMLKEVEHDSLAVAGITLGGDPLVSGVAMASANKGRILDALIVRKEPKGYGTASWLEGPLPPQGSLITVLEDVVTTGISSLKAAHQLQKAGYIVKRIVSIVDRQEGGEIAIKEAGLDLISLFLLEEIADKFKKIVK